MTYHIIVMMDELEALRGQRVEVVYHGILYHGELAGSSENEIFIKTSTDWVTLPLEGVSSVRPGTPS